MSWWRKYRVLDFSIRLLKTISVFLLLAILFIPLKLHATHNRAGEITYRQISAYTYEVTVTTFTYTLSQADREELEVYWGDNESSMVPRVNQLFLPNFYKHNTYIGTHTYPGPGIFEIVMMDQNRNEGVENIPGSVTVPFTIKTTLMINPDIGFNNTPVMSYPPIDRAAVGEIFIHNPAAHDPDGDSLSYKLYVCLGLFGEEVDGYSLPPASDSIAVNEITGDLIWVTPIYTGKYNVAILIEEWRNGIKISQIIRDIQIEVLPGQNNPPVLDPIEEMCVVVDSVISISVRATDVDMDGIDLSAYGGPIYMNDSSASFTINTETNGLSRGTFVWKTACSHIRKQPYQIVFKAEDNDPDLALVDVKNLRVRVICPAPENLIATTSNNAIFLSWDKSFCANASGYKIYRKKGPSSFTPDSCETGVPEYTGYQFIGLTNSWNLTEYYDDNNGHGLTQGYEYCYRVIAFFKDSAESYSSKEICTFLKRGIPMITKVSVDTTGTTNGSIEVEWAKPREFDSIYANGPYKYLLYRSNDYWGNNLVLIDSMANLDDTIYYDTQLNTTQYPYSYKVEFYNDSVGKRFLIGSPQIASSVFLEIVPSDNTLGVQMNHNVPWVNQQYIVYRQNKTTLLFDSIATTDTAYYVDAGLPNGMEYCYRVQSIGHYFIDHVVDPIVNFSQITCGEAVDTVPPCNPQMVVSSNCDSASHHLSWVVSNEECGREAVMFLIRYSPTTTGPMVLIDSIDATNPNFLEYKPDASMAGCYSIASVDSFGNENPNVVKVCADECSYYELPNIFTPNADGYNDHFIPGPYSFVEKVDMQIFDRWGILMFKTDDPDIRWDGREMTNDLLVPSGVYYYICVVYEYRLGGVMPRTLTGFIQVVSEPHPKQE